MDYPEMDLEFDTAIHNAVNETQEGILSSDALEFWQGD